MSGGLVTAAYIVAAILFIFSLAGLSKHETSQQGNYYGIAGMAIALVATILGPDSSNVAWILLAMVIGGAIGIRLAKKVEMTEMPELVAILHSFVGLAAVLVGFNSYLQHETGMEQILVNIHLTEVFLGIFIGAVTFTGSVVAFGKLCGKMSSKPLMLPNRHKLNRFRAYRQHRHAGTVPAGDDRDCPGVWLAPGGLHRRRGYAGRGINAELLLRLGGSGGGLYAQQRPADRNRCAGRFFRCNSVLHHV